MASRKQAADPAIMKRHYYEFIFKSPEHAAHWAPILEAARLKNKPKHPKQTVCRLAFMDFDQAFAMDPEPNVIPAGYETVDGKEITVDDVKKLMFQMTDGNLNFVAACKCGFLRGNYNLNSVCPKCGEKVRSAFADEVGFSGWLVIPNELPPLLHPAAYRPLRKWMGKIFKQNVYLLDGLLDPDVELPEPYASTLGQGAEYFYKNFDNIIAYVASLRKGQKAVSNELMLQFCKQWRHCMFVRHIPVLNQSLHVMTKSGTMTYNDDPSEYILATWLQLNTTINKLRRNPDMNEEAISQRMWAIYSAWMQYVDMIIEPKLSGKTGFIRKNLLGARMHASCRAVIVPITRNAWADEIELPWRMVVGVYKLEIMNILQNRYGKDVNEAGEIFNQALVTYVPEVDACLRTLHEECPFKGFPILMGRNPTLRHGEKESSRSRVTWSVKCA